MTIKDTIRKYTNELKLVTHIPAKEVEILMLHLLEKNTIWLHLNYNVEFEKEKELAILALKEYFLTSLDELKKLTPEKRLEKKYQKIMNLGSFLER